jgi:hypothetical protein
MLARRSLAAAACAVLVACGGVTPGGPSGAPVTATVGPAGRVVQGPDGMVLGVPAGSLASMVDVTLSRAEAPTTTLPDGATAVGRAYRITASADAFADATERGFMFGLPVPDEIDGTRTAMVHHLPGDAFSEAGEDTWHLVHGHFDESRRLLLAPAAALRSGGDVVRLVTGPELEAPPSLAPPAGTAQRAAVTVCLGWLDAFEGQPATGVTAAQVAAVVAELDAALDVYRALGFQPFLLRTTGWIPYLSGNSATFWATDCSEVKYLASVQLGGGNVVGRYSPSQQLMIVFASSAGTPEMRETVFHELFHAIQARYLGPAPLEATEYGYFLEATAILAEALGKTPMDLDVTRSDAYNLRVVDKTLVAPRLPGSSSPDAYLPYQAQDFWSFVARSHGRTFHAFMPDFLMAGVAPANVDGVLRQAPYTSSLHEQYRKWVVDQVFDLASCSFTAEAVDGLQQLGSVSVTDGVPQGLFAARSESREKLTARVLKVAVSHATNDQPFQLALRVEDDWADLEAKTVAFIQTRAGGGGPCAAHGPDDFTRDDDEGYAYSKLTVAPGQTDELYVLLVNGDHDTSASGRLLLDPAPAITADVSAAPASIAAEVDVPMRFEIPFDDRGENVKRLNVTVELGGELEGNFGLDTEDSDLTEGFSGASGTGAFTPSVIVYCSEQGRNPLTLTFQLLDALDFESEERSVDVTVDYGDCP